MCCQVKMRSLGWTLIQYDWYSYKKGKFGHRDMHTRRILCEHEGKDSDDASTNQGMPKIASKPPEARGETWNRFFLTVLEGTLSSWSSSLHICGKVHFCCCKSSIHGSLLWQPQEINSANICSLNE